MAAGMAVVWTAAERKGSARRFARAVAVAVAGAAVPVGAGLLHLHDPPGCGVAVQQRENLAKGPGNGAVV
ncbi:MAG: hypothetical protein ACKOD2_18190, partial [Ilumatobacteraceae bacterium]